MDQDVAVGCCVDENRVGGGWRHCKVRAGKSSDSGSNSNGFELALNCCL